jgi:hypothetical protein
VTLPLAQLGLAGSSSFDAARFHATVVAQQPHSMILLPQMLRAWVGHLMQSGRARRLAQAGGRRRRGGRRQAPAGRARCRHSGLRGVRTVRRRVGANAQPAGADRPAARARLAACELRIAADGESGGRRQLFLGYPRRRTDRRRPEWWPTGDLGRIDAMAFCTSAAARSTC